MVEPRRIALALGSGGARGYAHIGAINELESRGFEVAGVAGSSMGALIGGVFAAGKLTEFTEWALSLTQFEVIRLLDPSIQVAGAIRAEKILDHIREILGDITIEELPMPYVAIATDLVTGRAVWFQRGAVDTAIRASIAIPGVISPLLTHGRVLADGGILDPLPVVATAGIDADLTIGISLSGDAPGHDDWATPATPSDPGALNEWVGKIRRSAEQLSAPVTSVIERFAAASADDEDEKAKAAVESAAETEDDEWPNLGRIDVMNRSLDVMQAALARYQRAGHPPDVLIEIPRTAGRTLDFHRAEELIELGRNAAAKALDEAGLFGPAASTSAAELGEPQAVDA